MINMARRAGLVVGPQNTKSRHLIGSGTFALSGRILQLLISTLTGLLIPLVLDRADVGVFFIAQAAIAAGAVVAQFGLTITVPTIVAASLAKGDRGRARVASIQILCICGVTGASVSLCLGGIFLFVPAETELAVSLRAVAPLVIPFPPLLALLAVIVELHRASGGMRDASFLPVAPSAVVACFILTAFALGFHVTLDRILLIQLLGSLAAVAVAAVTLALRMHAWKDEVTLPPRPHDIIMESLPNLFTTLVFFLVASLDMWIVGAIGGATDVAEYGLGLRISALFLIPLAVVNATILPHIVASWTTGRRRHLQWLLTLTATAATVSTGLGFILFSAFGYSAITYVWGSDYAPAFYVALCLTMGNLFQTAGGSSGNLLLLLGKQRTAMIINLVIGVCTVLLAVFAMFNFGIVGVAIAYAAANAVRTLSFILYSRRRFHLNPMARCIKPTRIAALARFPLL